jgi:hypothetical protein
VAQVDEKLHECRVLTAGADGDFIVEVASEGVPFPIYVLTGPEFGCMLGIPRENIAESVVELSDCHAQLRRLEGEFKRFKSSVKAEVLASVLGGKDKPSDD